MQYTREQLRDFIKCPQLGSEEYGNWGALRLEQRLAINDLLNLLDSAETKIKQLEIENEELKLSNKRLTEKYAKSLMGVALKELLEKWDKE